MAIGRIAAGVGAKAVRYARTKAVSVLRSMVGSFMRSKTGRQLAGASRLAGGVSSGATVLNVNRGSFGRASTGGGGTTAKLGGFGGFKSASDRARFEAASRRADRRERMRTKAFSTGTGRSAASSGAGGSSGG